MKINIKCRKGALTAQPLPGTKPDQIVAMPVELLTVREAASIARVSEPTIRRWLRCEGLPRFGSKGRVRIDKADLVKFLKGEGA
ncbi:helix-turn-helix domain-containing protein [Sphingobium baderi]|nr:helix-turn-helix domain-containing protein [Sphingobium baderi]